MSSSNETGTYVLLGVVALLFTGMFAPLLAAFYGIVSQGTADAMSEGFSLMLAMAGVFAAVGAVALSVVCLVKGPNRVRLRLATWYVSGPALFTCAALLDPERANAPSPLYNAMMAASLGFACALPALWLWKGRAKGTSPAPDAL